MHSTDSKSLESKYQMRLCERVLQFSYPQVVKTQHVGIILIFLDGRMGPVAPADLGWDNKKLIEEGCCGGEVYTVFCSLKTLFVAQ